jgi:hypothetical protein
LAEGDPATASAQASSRRGDRPHQRAHGTVNGIAGPLPANEIEGPESFESNAARLCLRGFIEGFDSADLKNAMALLDELADDV